MTVIPKKLSEQVFDIKTEDEMEQWLRDVDKAVGGMTWKTLGASDDNVHTVQVASDPGAAIVERITNAIDAVLDLEAVRRGEMPSSPAEAAQRFFNVSTGGVSEMEMRKRQELANLIRVTNQESGVQDRPTIEVQDEGTGQHPSRFEETLLSLHHGNKKTKKHQMGVYNAGSAATYAFCNYTVLVSRCAPALLDGMHDEIGVAVVRYNELDPDKYKSGVYEFCVDASGDILRLDLSELPTLPYGTYVKHVSYELADYSRSAHEPKNSLHHLANAALPDPLLPFWVEERRVDRFKGVKGTGERRGIYGLVARLKGKGTADYNDERGPLSLGPENGSVTLRYFVLDAGQDPGAFVTPKQGLSFVLNGQRQGTKDRYWVKRSTQLNFIWSRLVILIDCNNLTSAAKRHLFASTREQTKESAIAKKILDRVLEELNGDDELIALDEEARQRTLSAATEDTSDKVKKQLANKIAAFIQGAGAGGKGGASVPKKTPRPPKPKPKPRPTDDSTMLDIPDTLEIRNEEPIRIYPGKTTPIIVFLNAKNGFLPDHASALSVVVGGELMDKVRLRSKGKLVGGIARLTLEADADAPLATSTITVTLVEPALGIVLTDSAKLEVAEPPKKKESPSTGGGPDIHIHWVERAGWGHQEPAWNEETAGTATLGRQDTDGQKDVIVKAEFMLNAAFQPFEDIINAKKLSADKLKQFQEAYTYPLCWGLFEQGVSEWKKEHEADEQGVLIDIDDDYVRGERTRLARAILMAMAPDLAVAIESDD